MAEIDVVEILLTVILPVAEMLDTERLVTEMFVDDICCEDTLLMFNEPFTADK